MKDARMPQVPVAARFLVRLLVPEQRAELILGDLEEDFTAAVRERGVGAARREYWRAGVQAIVSGGRWYSEPGTLSARRGWRPAYGAGVMSDIRHAVRSLRRDAWSATTIVVTLALGIGPATAIYAVFDYVVFRPLPGVAEPDRLVTVYYQMDPATPSRAGATYAHLEAMRDGAGALAGLATWSRREVSFATHTDAPPMSLDVMTVSRGWFELLGVRPGAGRFFSDAEYDAPGHDVVVVSERFAREAFGGPTAIGRDVFVNGRPFRIVGIAREYAGLDPLRRDALWVPFLAQLSPGDAVQAKPDVFSMVGRLRMGSTIEQAQAEVLRASQGVGAVTVQDITFEPTLFAGVTDGIGLTHTRLLRIYRILMAGAAILLALACVNAANLLLARNFKRQRDLVVRSAIGASRYRLLRELVVESSVLALLAGALGLALSIILAALFRGTRLLSYLPALEDLTIDGRVVTFCAITAAATLALFAVVPALMASRVDLHEGLRASARATPRSQRLRAVLVATQFALSFTLVASAGLMATTVWKLQALELGIDTAGVYSFRLAPSRVGHEMDASGAIFRDTRRRLEESPGILAAAVAWSSPFDSYQRMAVVRPGEDGGAPVAEIGHLVSPEYFDALGIPRIAGRTFTPAEDLPAPAGVRSVVVNEAFARKWFGTPNATGRSFAVQQSRDVATFEIIGVVGNTRYRQLRDGFPPMIYIPAAYRLRAGVIIVRTSLPATDAAALVRGVVHEVDPLLPAGQLRTIRDDAAVAFAEERLLARLGIVIAALAALLAVTGLYAVIASYVNDRVQEFGIRRALGASGVGVVSTVLRRFGIIITAGIGVGTFLVFATTRLFAARLYGVSPLDPVTIGAAAFALTFAGLLAVWLPARRALAVDPVAALRAD